MDEVGVGSSKGGSVTDQRLEAGRGSDVSTSNVRLQGQQTGTADTTLSDRSASVIEVLDTVDAAGGRVSSYTDTVAWMVQSFIDGNWAQFSALEATMFLNTMGAAMFLDPATLETAKLSPEHVQQAIENITRTIEDEEVLECVTLAMDVVTHPEKNGDFDVTTDGSGPKLGKKDALRRLKTGLKKLNSMDDQGDQGAIGKAKELITIAQNIAQKKLNVARGAKICGVAANIASIAANIAGVIGTSGASLIPCVINVATANLASVGNIAQAAIGKTYAETILGSKVKLVGFDPYLEECYGLAIDVLTHPEKSRDFEGPGGAKLGKKETKRLLKETLGRVDRVMQEVTPGTQAKLAKVRQDIQTAHDVVSSKLNKAIATKGLKIGGAILATAASIAACVATFGTAAPIAIPAAISASVGLLGTGISDVKLLREMLQNKH
ncbi:MAG: hypothetical protein LBF49_03250 [Puniceicoccales bacterium]|jgi:hypothetical protein|nr:hypothetical protein [Puniceicoccales bacterium]